MRPPIIETVGSLAPEASGIYLHLDLDVIDAGVAGVNVYSAPGGIDGAQLDDLVAAITATFPVRGVSLTAYDPAFDTAARVPPIALRLLRTLARSLA